MGFLSILILDKNNKWMTSSCHYIQHITLHKNLVCLAITNLKYKDQTNFCQFLLLLSGDVSLNPGPVQLYLAVNTNIWEPLNKNDLYFLHINISNSLPKINELKCVANKTGHNYWDNRIKTWQYCTI